MTPNVPGRPKCDPGCDPRRKPAPGRSQVVQRRPRLRVRAFASARDGPTDPLALRDGTYLRLSISLFREHSDKAGKVVLKVRKAGAQYQLDKDASRWVFRYDYLREPGNDDPQAHLQIRGVLTEDGLPAKEPLHRIRFPTGRFSLEGVIRLLAEEFHVPTASRPEVWRPALTTSEREFFAIAHPPVSGPAA